MNEEKSLVLTATSLFSQQENNTGDECLWIQGPGAFQMYTTYSSLSFPITSSWLVINLNLTAAIQPSNYSLLTVARQLDSGFAHQWSQARTSEENMLIIQKKKKN